MDKRDIILRCLYENWPVEVSMIGDDLVTRIVDDALLGHRTEIPTAPGGFNFDLTPYIDTIIAGASLLVSVATIWPRDPPDRTNEDRQIEILVEQLPKPLKVERGKATKLVRLFVRTVSNGR